MATNKEKLIAGAQKLVEKGQFDKAIKEYLKVVAEDDKDVRIWLKIGDLYAKMGKKPEATETYQKVAQFYSDQGFYLKAVAVYKQILKIDPRLVDVNQQAGGALQAARPVVGRDAAVRGGRGVLPPRRQDARSAGGAQADRRARSGDRRQSHQARRAVLEGGDGRARPSTSSPRRPSSCGRPGASTTS